jgi:hypothetical protein
MDEWDNLINEVDDIKKNLDNKLIDILEESATECIAETKSRTGVITGNLRRSWTHDDVEVDSNNNISVELGSSLSYAEPYEEGHKQGRYYIEGKHVLRDSLTITEYEMNEKVDKAVDEAFRGWN